MLKCGHIQSNTQSIRYVSSPIPPTRRLPRFMNNGRRRNLQRISAEGSEGGSSGESTESLFMRELERRRMSAGSGADPGKPSATSTSTTEEESRPPPPPGPEREQLGVSRGLSSEGLEGLIPRAKELVKLGGSFWLSFLPFILAVSLLFTGLYYGFGDSFVHGGRVSSSPPSYVDPYDLLSEPTVDPMIPFYDR